MEFCQNMNKCTVTKHGRKRDLSGTYINRARAQDCQSSERSANRILLVKRQDVVEVATDERAQEGTSRNRQGLRPSNARRLSRDTSQTVHLPAFFLDGSL